MRKYRLEYNEKTGYFHLDNYTHDENTNNWNTIFECVSDKEIDLFFDFIEYGFPYKLKKHKLSYVKSKSYTFIKILRLHLIESI
jgi:hypothetical protein